MTEDLTPAYPLPAHDDDARFGFGLVFDVAVVLEQHGYPRPQAGADWVRFQQGLYRMIYVAEPS